MDLVSIIIPAYNSANTIRSTVESVLRQTYSNIEIIVINDGSSDETDNICIDFKNKGIIYLNQINKGASAARNLGLSKANGRYIQFLDADDLLHPTKIALQVAAMEKEDADLSFTFWGYFDDNLDNIKPFQQQHVKFNELTNGISMLTSFGKENWFMPIHGWLVNIELIRKSGYWNEHISNNDDGEYFTRVLSWSQKVTIVKEQLAFYRISNNISLSNVNTFQKAISAYNSWQLILSYLKGFHNNNLLAYPKKGLYVSYINTKHSMPQMAKLFAKEFDKIDEPFFLKSWKYYWLVKYFGLYKAGKIFFLLIKLRLIKTNYYPI